jgi:hypothetical protein
MTHEQRVAHVQECGLELAGMLDKTFESSKDAAAALAIAFARILADQSDESARDEYIEEFVKMAKGMTFAVGTMLIRK